MKVLGRRPWVIPLIFGMVLLSLPAELAFKARVSEPYPALFFPAFKAVPDVVDGGYEYNEASFVVDGRPLTASDVFGVGEVVRLRRLCKRNFPRRPHGPVTLRPSVRTLIAGRLEALTGRPPDSITVAWTRKRYDIRSRKVTTLRTVSSYRVPLVGAP